VTRAVRSGEPGVVVTVLTDRTAAFARPSSRLFVRDKGTVKGRIHAQLDADLAREALQALESKRSQLRSYKVEAGGLRFVGVRGGDLDVFYEVLDRRPRLIVVGAGHIAVPLAQLGKLLDYEVIVIDDRPEYANRDRFPEADGILVGPYRETVAALSVHGDTYIVLVTRGHVHDQACLEQVLGSEAAYIGMIGSKRRVRTVLSHLADSGRDLAQIQRVHAPVGLDINAQTPAEIAVSVAAEIISVRRGGNAPSLALAEKFHV
jgi:xanthine dehydrogenase accessory factor